MQPIPITLPQWLVYFVLSILLIIFLHDYVYRRVLPKIQAWLLGRKMNRMMKEMAKKYEITDPELAKDMNKLAELAKEIHKDFKI